MAAVNCVSGMKLDDRIIRVEIDVGYCVHPSYFSLTLFD